MGEKKVERPGSTPLALEHEATRYANALVCRRCGQDWPCTFHLGIPIKDRIAAEQDDGPAQAIRLAWSQHGLAVTQWW